MTSTCIYLGDLARALRRLRPEDVEERRKIAALLGFDLEAIRPEAPKARPSRHRSETSSESDSDRPPLPKRRIEPSGRAYDIEADGETSVGEVVGTDVDLFSFEPELPRGADAWAEPESAESGTIAHPPLLAAREAPAILAESVTMIRDTGAIDLARVVRMLARCEPLEILPRQPVKSLARGCDVLVDFGPGLGPFLRDRRDVTEALISVVGPGRLTTWYFKDCPQHGVRRRPNPRWQPYPTPRSGRPVLMITDLGIGRPPLITRRARVADWLAFAARMREAGCPLLALVPYPPERWPRALAKVMTIVPWDRATSTLTVRRARNTGSRGGR